MAVLALPEIRQRDDCSCGAAVAVSALRFFGCRIGVAEAAAYLHTSGVDGTDPRSLEAFLRNRGLNATSGEMDAADLRFHSSQGRPVVCVLTGHYVLSAGLHRGRVHLMDPAEGTTSARLNDFLARWHDADRLGATYRQWGIAAWSS